MSSRTEPDPIITSWLADGPTGMPAEVRSRLVASTRDRSQAVARVPVRGVVARPRPGRDGSLRLLVPLVAAIALVSAIAAGSVLLRRTDDPPGPPISGLYTSARYGYTFDPPDGWTVEPATSDWRVTDPWDTAPAADVFRSPDGLRFAVVGDPMAADSKRTIYAQAFVPDRPEWDRQAQACRPQGTTEGPAPTPIVVGGRPAWVELQVGPYAADIRAACGYVDAVVLHGSYAYVLSLAGPPRPDADVATFGRLAATFRALDRVADAEPTPTPRPRATPRPTRAPQPLGPLDVPFVSSRYAYAIKHPDDWLASHASETYVPGRRSLTLAPVADRLDGPGKDALSVVAVDLLPPTDLDAWLERWAPSRYAFDTVCKFGGTMIPGSTVGWQPTTVGGYEARVRSQCAYAEAAIQIGDRLWYVAHRSGQRMSSGERADLDAFLETMTFDPGAEISGADPGTEQHSTRYAYSILTPTGWTVESATEDFVAGLPWTAGPGADRYAGPTGESFTVVAVDLPADMTRNAWLARYALSRVIIQSDGHQHCVFREGSGTTTVESSASGWYDTSVAGREASVRSDCASIDSAILLGRRLYLLSHDRGRPAPYGDRPAFDVLADALWFDADTR